MNSYGRWILMASICCGVQLASTACLSEVRISRLSYGQYEYVSVFFSGSITTKDYEKVFRDARTERRRPSYGSDEAAPLNWRIVNSTGGDVEAAMKIGRLIRSRGGPITVMEQCLSACVLLVAAGEERRLVGRVGIHRPYGPTDTESSTQGQTKKYRELGRRVKAFLEEMNVSPALYDDMLQTPPESMKILTLGQLYSYGLVPIDPAFDEARKVDFARSWGVSREKIGRVLARASDECDHLAPKVDGSVFSEEDLKPIRECKSRVFAAEGLVAPK